MFAVSCGWEEGSSTGSNSVAVSRPSTPWDPDTWPELDEWMAMALETMHELFRPIVRGLDAAEGGSRDHHQTDGEPIEGVPISGLGSDDGS